MKILAVTAMMISWASATENKTWNKDFGDYAAAFSQLLALTAIDQNYTLDELLPYLGIYNGLQHQNWATYWNSTYLLSEMMNNQLYQRTG